MQKKPAGFCRLFLFFRVIFRQMARSQIIFGFDLDICKKKFPFRFLPFGQDICQDPWRFIALDISVLIDEEIHGIIFQCFSFFGV